MIRKPLVLALGAVLALSVGCGKKDDDKKSGGNTKVKAPSGDNSNKGGTPPVAAGGYEAGDVTDGGKITGTVWYKGDNKSANFAMTKDQKVCIHDGKPDGSIVVADGKLANAIVYIDVIKKGKKWTAEPITLDNKECRFVPRISVAQHKGELTAKNSDAVLHNTDLTLEANSRALATEALPNVGQTAAIKLKKKGLVKISCGVHEWMKGYVWVSDHPYATVTAADGTFTFDQVPAGEYTIKYWHESLGSGETKVKVEAGKDAVADHELKG